MTFSLTYFDFFSISLDTSELSMTNRAIHGAFRYKKCFKIVPEKQVRSPEVQFAPESKKFPPNSPAKRKRASYDALFRINLFIIYNKISLNRSIDEQRCRQDKQYRQNYF